MNPSLVCAITKNRNKAFDVKMKKCHVVLATIFSLFLVLPSKAFANSRRLHVRYYSNKCPQAEFVVARAIARAFVKDPTVAASFIRILFHDCFVTVLSCHQVLFVAKLCS